MNWKKNIRYGSICVILFLVSCASIDKGKSFDGKAIIFNKNNRAKVILQKGERATFYVNDRKYTFKLVNTAGKDRITIEFVGVNRKELLNKSKPTHIALVEENASVAIQIGFVHGNWVTMYLRLHHRTLS